ncbi:MAG: VWA domain-containing protein [Bacillota bacterium]
MKNVRSFVIGILIIHIMLSGLAPTIALTNNTTNQDQLSLSINKVEPARKELILQKEGSQNIARTSLNFEVMRNGMLTENPRKPLDVVFVFDKSASMNFEIDKKTSRLDRAKEAMQTAATIFSEANANRVNKDRFGLVEFNSNAVVSNFDGNALTKNVNEIAEVVKEIVAPEGSLETGTNYSDSLIKAKEILSNNSDENRDQVIIFLTDGEPTVLKTKDIPRGKYQKEIQDCWWIFCDNKYEDYSYDLLKNHKENITTEFIVYSNGSSGISKRSFKHNNNTIVFSNHAKAYVENHAEDTSSLIRNGDTILYPVGFGEASKTYLDKLASKTSNNISMARIASGSNLNEIFESLVREIETPSLSEVSLEVKIPSGVRVEGSDGIKVETRNGIKYAIVTPANGNVKYEVGVGPGVVSVPNLPIEFNSNGDYFFEVKLKYKDIEGIDQIMVYKEEIKVSVQNQVAPSFELDMQFSTTAPIKDNTIKLQKSNIMTENKDTFNIIYTIKPYGKLPSGSKGNLSDVQLRQRIPAGLSSKLGSGMTETIFPDGSKEILIPIKQLTYETKNGNLIFSEEQLQTSLELRGIHSLNAQALPDPSIEFKDSSRPNAQLKANVSSRFNELVEMVIKLIDLDVQPTVEYRGNQSGNISKYVRDSGQLLASTTLKDAGGNPILIPVEFMEFDEEKSSIIIKFHGISNVFLPLIPTVAVVLSSSDEVVFPVENGQYIVNQAVKIFFNQFVTGGTAVYEVRTKTPNRTNYSNWRTINPEDIIAELNDLGTSKFQVKASGGFIRNSFEDELIINFNGISDLSLNYSNEMYIGDTQTIEAILETTDTLSDVLINWNSSDNSIASVNNNGVVTAKKTGEVSITASINGSQISEQAQMKILDFPNYTMSFHKPYYYVKVNQPLNSLQGQLRFDPPQLKNKIEVEWSVDLPDKFYIDQNGKGRGISPGVVFVTATSKEDRNIRATTMVIIGNGEDDISNPGNNYRW